MRYMGLDLGTKTLGISLSNGIIASVYGTLRHDEEYDRIANEVRDLAIEKKVDVIVLGFPKNMNNTIGERASITLDFKKKLEEKTKLEVIMEDERLTSVVAKGYLGFRKLACDDAKDVFGLSMSCEEYEKIKSTKPTDNKDMKSPSEEKDTPSD